MKPPAPTGERGDAVTDRLRPPGGGVSPPARPGGRIAPAAGLQELVQVAGEMELEPLLRCLAAAGGSDADLGGLVARWSKDPGGFARSLDDQLFARVRARFDALMGTRLAELRAGGRARAPEQVADEALAMLRQLGRDHAGLGCLLQFLEPRLPALKAAAVQAARSFETEAEKLFEEKVLPAVYEGVAATLQLAADKGLGKLAEPHEMRLVVAGLYAESLSEQLAAAKGMLDRGAPAPEALAKTGEWPEAAALRLGWELLRFRGHRAIDDPSLKLGPASLVDKAVNCIHLSKETIEKVASAISGLIPEAGAAACAVVQFVVKVLYNGFFIPKLRDKIMELLHDGFDRALDEGWKALEQHRDPGGIWREAGPLGAVLKDLTRQAVLDTAESHLPGTRTRLLDYNAALSSALRAA